MATYTKLRNGSWGVRVDGSVTVGQVVTVEKRSGEQKSERIERVLWTGDGISLCAIAASERPSNTTSSRRSRRGTWTGCSCGSVEEYERDGDCASCQHDRY